MPIALDFREDGHVIYARMSDPLTGQDLTNAFTAQIPYYNNAAFQVHQIINVEGLKKFPTGIFAVRRASPALNHPNRGLALVVGANPFVRSITESIFRLAHYEGIQFLKTDDEAWDFVHMVMAEETLVFKSG